MEAPEACNVFELPAQISINVSIFKIGLELTFIFTKSVSKQVDFFPITVYCKLFVGLTVTEVPEVELILVLGNHWYVLAPLAVIVCDCPEHIVALFGLTLMLKAVSVNFMIVSSIQSLASFIVTLYVLVIL